MSHFAVWGRQSSCCRNGSTEGREALAPFAKAVILGRGMFCQADSVRLAFVPLRLEVAEHAEDIIFAVFSRVFCYLFVDFLHSLLVAIIYPQLLPTLAGAC